MIAHVARLTLWEWFKLRRRWMPWILLAVAVIIMQAGLWFTYSAYHNETLQEIASGGLTTFGVAQEVDGEMVSVEVSCVDIINEEMPKELERLTEEQQADFLQEVERFREESCENISPREDLRSGFTIPVSIAGSMEALAGFAPVLVMILAASLMGTEYGWGTLRTTLTRGAGRWQVLASKLALLVLACVAGFIVVGATVAVASLLAGVVPPDEAGSLADTGSWSDVAVSAAKGVYALAPYIALSVFLAVLAQSAAIGMAASLGYYIVELIGAPLLRLTGLGEKIADALIGSNVTGWMQSAFVSVDVGGGGSPDAGTDTLRAFLVILAYVIVLCAAAFLIFLRRDIAGAKGD